VEGEQLAKSQLGSSYEIKDLGKAKLILNMYINRNLLGDVTLSQHAYCEHLLKQFNMDLCSPTTTPLPSGLVLSAEDCPSTPDEVDEMKNTLFYEALGSLMWLQVAIRPDLVYSVNKLAHFTHNPGKTHWNALKHMLTYVKGMMNYEITYKGGGDLEPIGYINSNYAGCKDTRRSTEGNIFIIAGGLISWECKRQDMVTLSMVEVEFMAFSKATTQALWLSKYFDKVGLPITRPLKIFADNSGSISNSLSDKNYQYTKHINMQHHFIKEHTKLDDIAFQYTTTTENIANILTKELPQDTLHKFICRMGLNPRVANTSVQEEC